MEFLDRAVALHRAGRLAEAEVVYREILRIWPNQADALHLLGLIAHSVKKYDAALQLYDQSIAINSKNPAAFSNRGITLQDLNRPADALQSFDIAVALQPTFAEAHGNRGTALHELGRDDEALASYDRAISIDPNFAEFYFNRAAAHLVLRRYEAALEDCDAALRVDPVAPLAYSNRGAALAGMHRYGEALESFNRAIALAPDCADAYANRAVTLHSLNHNRAAVESCDRAILLNPSSVQAHVTRASLLFRVREYPKALESVQQALRLDENVKDQAGTALYLKRLMCDWSNTEYDLPRIESDIDAGKRVIAPFDCAVFCESPVHVRKATELSVQDKYGPGSSIAAVVQVNQPRRDKIVVGYFSADFHNHATTYLMAQLFERHDKTRFEIIGFSFGSESDDEMRRRTTAAMDKFVDVRSVSNRDAAALSRKMGVDIAIDLKGFTADNRFEIFTERAAPLQVSYLGFPGTTGAPCMDYLIADETLVPERSRPHYSEKIIYLPDSYQVNDTARAISPVMYTRAEEGLPEIGFVFCCFNSNYKITPAVFDVWMKILSRVEGSVLWLLQENQWAANNLRNEAAKRGIEPQRLIFAPKRTLPDHLARHRLADLFLDTLPCNAHTTASDALWAGLPLLTCMGETFAGRVASSLLRAVRMPELIATSFDEYEELAVSLALNSVRLNTLKLRLQTGRNSVPLAGRALAVCELSVSLPYQNRFDYDTEVQASLLGASPFAQEVVGRGPTAEFKFNNNYRYVE